MAELYAMKEKLLLAGIVVCPTLEELYAALNSAKARGTRLRHGQPRSSSRSHPASPATGSAARPHLAPHRDAAGPPLHRRRPCQEGLPHDAEDAAAALRGARHVPPHRQRPERQATRGLEPRVRLGRVSNTARASHTRAAPRLSNPLPPLQLRTRQVPRYETVLSELTGYCHRPMHRLSHRPLDCPYRLQAQDPPARQALGAHRVLRLSVQHGTLPVQ